MTKQTIRQHWMSVLAKAEPDHLIGLWADQKGKSQFQILRQPETGLVMIRGRIGGSGARFNTGEATVTRCAVTNQDGRTGHAYILGRSHIHARTAAEIDADLQVEALHQHIMDRVISPLEKEQKQQRNLEQSKIANTKVDFFTMVRGED